MNLSTLTDLEFLSVALRCSGDQIRDIIVNPEQFYVPLTVRRRASSSRPRFVFDVMDPLRRIHRTIALWLRPHLLEMDDCVHGFRPSRCFLSNARAHVGKECVLTADLNDFFGTIPIGGVCDVFESLGAARQVAITLARICCYRGVLPQGARCSPALANLFAMRLDKIVLGAIDSNCTYTRYADDLAISGPPDLVPETPQLSEWVASAGLRIRPDSVRRMHRQRGQYVTGLSVSGDSPRMPRRVRRSIEAFLHLLEKHGNFEFAYVKAFPELRKKPRGRAGVTLVAGLCCSYRRVEPLNCDEWIGRLRACLAARHLAQ